ncbi:hypothetical protein BC938DRAFT_472579, partial [Jimgerdemannia flammicorona]
YHFVGSFDAGNEGHSVCETLFKEVVDKNCDLFRERVGKDCVLCHGVVFLENGTCRSGVATYTFVSKPKLTNYLIPSSHSLVKSKLSFSTIFEELPIVVHNSHLVTALLHELDMPLADPAKLRSLTSFNDAAVSIRLAEENSPLTPNFEVLDLELDPFMEKNLEDLLDCTEAQHQEQNNYMYWQRSVAREQAKVQQFLVKRKAENAHRISQGQLPLLEEEAAAQMFKMPPEPSRLESMLLNAQMHNYCKQLNQFAGPSLGRLFAVQELQK